MGVARYILSRLSSLLATLPFSKRASFFTPTLPTLVRFCRAFPPLCDEATGFLLELGRVASSHAAASAGYTQGELFFFKAFRTQFKKGQLYRFYGGYLFILLLGSIKKDIICQLTT